MEVTEWTAVLGNVGEFVGAIAMLVTLVYLAIQVRQNTTAQRSESRLATTRTLTNWYETVLTHPELMRVWTQCHTDPTGASAEDRQTFMWMITCMFSRIDEIHSQHRVGLVSDRYWNDFRGVAASMLANPLIKAGWDSRSAVFTDGFREAIESTPESLKTWSPGSVAESMAPVANKQDSPPAR